MKATQISGILASLGVLTVLSLVPFSSADARALSEHEMLHVARGAEPADCTHSQLEYPCKDYSEGRCGFIAGACNNTPCQRCADTQLMSRKCKSAYPWTIRNCQQVTPNPNHCGLLYINATCQGPDGQCQCTGGTQAGTQVFCDRFDITYYGPCTQVNGP